MGGIKAIETSYKGYRFRSRLEARWAVFFDTLGIPYEYESQGFEINSYGQDEDGAPDERGWRYLPDFYLPATKTWVEVKGTLDGLPDDYLHMIACAIDWGGQLPDVGDSDWTRRGLLWLGSIPEPVKAETPGHLILQHEKGGWCRAARFNPEIGLCNSAPMDGLDGYFDSSWGVSAGEKIRSVLEQTSYPPRAISWEETCPAKLMAAYRAARSARFEHGESGAPRQGSRP